MRLLGVVSGLLILAWGVLSMTEAENVDALLTTSLIIAVLAVGEAIKERP